MSHTGMEKVRPEKPFPLGHVLKPYSPLLYKEKFIWSNYSEAKYCEMESCEHRIYSLRAQAPTNNWLSAGKNLKGEDNRPLFFESNRLLFLLFFPLFFENFRN